MSVTLRGMTWSHPRGYDPMVACSALWEAKTGVEIAWDKRSLLLHLLLPTLHRPQVIDEGGS